MNIDFLSDLSDELQAALKEYGLNVPSPEQLRQQDKRSDELKDKIENYDYTISYITFLLLILGVYLYANGMSIYQTNCRSRVKLSR